jgi:hypothetical protein
MTCLEQWKHYRALRWQAFFGWLFGSYMGRFTVDLSALYYFCFHRMMAIWVLWVLTGLSLLVGFSLLFYTWGRCGWWPCPRCGRAFFAWGPRFFNRDVGSNPFVKKCRNCGLRKWQCD